MSTREAPKGEELLTFCKEWRSRDKAGKLKLCELHNKSYKCLKDWVNNYCPPKDKPEPVVTEEKEPVVNLPPIKLRDYKAQKVKRGDEEEAVLHCGDGHAGKITESFNEDVYQVRMDTMFDSIMTIITLHRKMYPINKLRILNTGDNTQGENPYQGSNIGSVKRGARDQTWKVAYPAWTKLIGSLKQEFAEVEFDGFPGNHGYEKAAPETSREDIRLYDLLKAYFTDHKGITINTHEKFSDIVNVQGFKFFCTHLDGINSINGIPLFAIKRRLDAWYIQYGGFRYVLGGHFHFRIIGYEMSSHYEFSMVGTLVSDDDWALKKLGISSNPSQNIYGVHPRHGMTWRYPLVVDCAFLPDKVG